MTQDRHLDRPNQQLHLGSITRDDIAGVRPQYNVAKNDPSVRVSKYSKLTKIPKLIPRIGTETDSGA